MPIILTASSEIVEKLFPIIFTSLALTLMPYPHPEKIFVVTLDPVEFMILRHIPLPLVIVLFVRLIMFDQLIFIELHTIGITSRMLSILIFEELVIFIASMLGLFIAHHVP